MFEKSKIISAAGMAAISNLSTTTNDRVEALKGGHGMINVAVIAAANVITQEILNGGDVKVKFADAVSLPVDDMIAKAINAAKIAGADGANAALIVASLMYLAGSSAQVGIPAGNRKLGATARMLAKVDRCGVAMLPTAKMNNKISGFPAVQAVYKAMMEGKLSPVDGRQVPMNVGGGPIYGHSALGEDIVWPAMAEKGAKIGTQAMLDAMAGASIHPHPFTAAIFGAAAILEIIHPDAEVSEKHGTYGKTTSAYLAGKTAAQTAGLPAKLHIKVTGQEYDTAQVIGDVGLILKDVGGASVIGMMAFEEIFGAFQENISGFSGGPVNAPLGHILAYAVVAMKILIENGGDKVAAAEAITKDRASCSFDPEAALISINTIARKSSEISYGPITSVLIEATEPTRANAVYRRANKAYEMLSSGKKLEEVVKELDSEKVAITEKYCGLLLSHMLGKDIKFDVLRIGAGARRTNKIAKKYWSFDPLFDVKLTIDGQEIILEGYAHDIVPKVSQGLLPEVAPVVPLAATIISELVLAGSVIFNITVPVGVASAMGIHTPAEAAAIAEKAAYVSAGIPGGKASSKKVGELAISIINCKYGVYE